MPKGEKIVSDKQAIAMHMEYIAELQEENRKLKAENKNCMDRMKYLIDRNRELHAELVEMKVDYNNLAFSNRLQSKCISRLERETDEYECRY